MEKDENTGYPESDLSVDVTTEEDNRYPTGGKPVNTAHRQSEMQDGKLTGENKRGVSPSHCAVCGQPIPPTDTTCPQHGNSNSSLTAETRDYDYEAKGISVAIVEADNKFHAMALASAAHDHLPEVMDQIDESELLYDTDENSISHGIITAWDGEYPDAVSLDSSKAEEMLTRIREVQANEDSDINAAVVNQFGETIPAKQDANNSQSNTDTQVWAIPGICYNANRNLVGETVEKRHCQACGKTDHVLEQDGTQNEGKEEEWTCIKCDRTQKVVEPKSRREYHKRSDNHDTHNAGLEKRQRKEFERVMQRIETSSNMSLEP